MIHKFLIRSYILNRKYELAYKILQDPHVGQLMNRHDFLWFVNTILFHQKHNEYQKRTSLKFFLLMIEYGHVNEAEDWILINYFTEYERMRKEREEGYLNTQETTTTTED